MRGERSEDAMVDLNGHEAGNGGYSQGMPTAPRTLLYSERSDVSQVSAARATVSPLPLLVGGDNDG